MSNVSVYEKVAKETAQLVSQKQVAYGDAFGKAGAVLRVLYPNGVTPDRYDDMLTVVRVLDKLFRIATNNDPTGESPWRDILGYALLSVARVEGVVAPSTEMRVEPATLAVKEAADDKRQREVDEAMREMFEENSHYSYESRMSSESLRGLSRLARREAGVLDKD